MRWPRRGPPRPTITSSHPRRAALNPTHDDASRWRMSWGMSSFHGMSPATWCVTPPNSWYLVEPHEAAARANEVEANEFAAELLTPSGWLARLIGSRGPDPGALTREVLSIGVSAQAACIRLSKVLPSGRVWAIVDAGGQISASGQTLETRIAPPQVGSPLARGLLDQFLTRVDQVPHGRARVVWWTFRASASGELRTALSGRSSSEIEALLLAAPCWGPTPIASGAALAA